MRKPYSRLRFLMSENDIDNKYLAQMLGRQVRYISQRMTGQRSWTIEEAVQICDLLHIPLEQLPEYFCQQLLEERNPQPAAPVVPYRLGA